ncbi:MAG: flagellin, partial [Planctomycetes bacterium]|nr:flagellin [Planctomycetota bacterium]
MSMRINTNISALSALRHLNQTTLSLNRTLSRLSSGLRIVSAADDPAGLIISEQLRGQISSLKAASRNVSEADKYFGIAEAALDEVNRMLVDMRAL